jgi:hypothetical protein
MKTHSLKNNSVVQGLARLSKFVILAGVAALAALPLSADARERHGDRHRGPDRHDRHDHRESYRGGYYRPAPRPVYRGWSRPGWYGAYPPVGYTDYRYIRALPPGYRVVYRGGSRYYYSNGSYYYPARYNNSGVYLNIRF